MFVTVWTPEKVAVLVEKYAEARNEDKGISRPLYAYSEDGSLVGEYSSLRDASEHLGINLYTIGVAMHCKRPTHGLWFSHDKKKSPK